MKINKSQLAKEMGIDKWTIGKYLVPKGAIEADQQRVTFCMKKRGMDWSREYTEAIVKVKTRYRK